MLAQELFDRWIGLLRSEGHRQCKSTFRNWTFPSGQSQPICALELLGEAYSQMCPGLLSLIRLDVDSGSYWITLKHHAQELPEGPEIKKAMANVTDWVMGMNDRENLSFYQIADKLEADRASVIRVRELRDIITYQNIELAKELHEKVAREQARNAVQSQEIPLVKGISCQTSNQAEPVETALSSYLTQEAKEIQAQSPLEDATVPLQV